MRKNFKMKILIITVYLSLKISPKDLKENCHKISSNKSIIEKLANLDNSLKKKLKTFFDNKLILEENLSKSRKAVNILLFNKFFQSREQEKLIPKRTRKNKNGIIYTFQSDENEKKLIGIKEINLKYTDLIYMREDDIDRKNNEIFDIFFEINNLKKGFEADQGKFLEYYTCFYSYDIEKVFIVMEELDVSFKDRFPSNGFRREIDQERRLGFYKGIFERFFVFRYTMDCEYTFFHLYYFSQNLDGNKNDHRSDIYLNGDDFVNFKIVNYSKVRYQGMIFGEKENEDSDYYPLNLKKKFNCYDYYQTHNNFDYSIYSIISTIIFLEYGLILKKTYQDDLINYHSFLKTIIIKDNENKGIVEDNQTIEDRLSIIHNIEHEIIYKCMIESSFLNYKYKLGTKSFKTFILNFIENPTEDLDQKMKYKKIIRCYIDRKGKSKKNDEEFNKYYDGEKKEILLTLLKELTELDYIGVVSEDNKDIDEQKISPLSENLFEFIMKFFSFDLRNSYNYPGNQKVMEHLDNFIPKSEMIKEKIIIKLNFILEF